MFSQVPIFQDVARPFSYPVLKQGSLNTITITAAFGTNYGNVALMPDQYFMLTNWRCWTNYDAFSRGFSSAGVTTPQLLSSQFVPNNFTVQITRGQNSLYSNVPVTQGQICSSGYLAGKVMPIPTIYGPRENFTFTFTDTTGLTALNDSKAAITLSIQMFMEGYVIPIALFDKFLNYFPAMRSVYA